MSMCNAQVGIYARVSSEQQAEANTIASQLAALRARVTADGCVLLPELEFLDDGYTDQTLVRPAWSGYGIWPRQAVLSAYMYIRRIVWRGGMRCRCC